MTEWNRDLIQYRIDRALETLEDARILQKSKRWKACVNRLYYACYYAVSALLLQKGLFSSKHTGIRSMFNLWNDPLKLHRSRQSDQSVLTGIGL